MHIFYNRLQPFHVELLPREIPKSRFLFEKRLFHPLLKTLAPSNSRVARQTAVSHNLRNLEIRRLAARQDRGQRFVPTKNFGLNQPFPANGAFARVPVPSGFGLPVAGFALGFRFRPAGYALTDLTNSLSLT